MLPAPLTRPAAADLRPTGTLSRRARVSWGVRALFLRFGKNESALWTGWKLLRAAEPTRYTIAITQSNRSFRAGSGNLMGRGCRLPLSRESLMIIVLKPHASSEVVDHVLDRIAALGFTPHLSQGVSRTIIGVIGDEAKLQVEPLQAIPGVEQVVPILKPFKLASREFHPDGSVFEIKGVKIGGGHLAVIAGPCAIESESLLFEIAGRVRDAGANILRGGAFKPRTSPYSFQGLGRDGLKILQAAGDRFGMPVVTEVMDPRQVEIVERYTDILQIGARNMQNFDLLKECGRTRNADPAQARHERDRQRPADVGRVCPLRRESAGDPLRARNPDVRGFDAEYTRPVDRAQHPGSEPLADHRRPQPRDGTARLDSGHGAGRRGLRAATASTSRCTPAPSGPFPTARRPSYPTSSTG